MIGKPGGGLPLDEAPELAARDVRDDGRADETFEKDESERVEMRVR